MSEKRTRELEAAVLTPENRELLETPAGRDIVGIIGAAVADGAPGTVRGANVGMETEWGTFTHRIPALVILGVRRGITSVEAVAVAALLVLARKAREAMGGFPGCDCAECRAARMGFDGGAKRPGKVAN